MATLKTETLSRNVANAASRAFKDFSPHAFADWARNEPGLQELMAPDSELRRDVSQLIALVRGPHRNLLDIHAAFARVTEHVERLAGEEPSTILRATLEHLGRWANAFDQVGSVDLHAFTAARKSLYDLECAPTERRRLYEEALGTPLATAVHTLGNAAATAIPKGALERVGAKLDSSGNGSTFKSVGLRLERVLRSVGSNVGLHLVDEKLDFLRNLVAVEMPVLSRLAFQLRPGGKDILRSAVGNYCAGAAEVLLKAWIPETQWTQIQTRIQRIAELCVDGFTTEGPLDAIREELSALMADWPECGTQLLDAARGFLNDPSALASDAAVANGLAKLNTTFAAQLNAAVETTPDSQEAFEELKNDVTAVARAMYHCVQIARLVADKTLDPITKAERLKREAEALGPLFIKLLQTLMTLEPFLRLIKFEKPEEREQFEFIMSTLAGLQDRVTPMSDEEVVTQVESSLQKKIDEAFVPGSFVMKPLGSASIGQAHLAKVERPGLTPFSPPRHVDVVVKVLRPGLEKKFDSDVRVARVLLSLGHEAARRGLHKPEHREFVDSCFTALNGCVNVLVESFSEERDFPREAKETRRFRRLLRGDGRIVVPKVYRSHSAGGVITLQYIPGDKFSTRVQRHNVSQKAKAEQLSPDASLEERASHWARSTYGLDPDHVSMTNVGGAIHVEFQFDNGAHPTGSVTLHADGTATSSDRLPDLSEEAILRLQKTLLASFVQQLLHGKLHGDFQGGNLLVLPDGDMFALLDYGQTVRFPPGQGLAPLEFLKGMGAAALPKGPTQGAGRPIGWVSSRYRNSAASRMAAAVVDMSDKRAGMSARERKQTIARIEEHIPQAAHRIQGLLEKKPDLHSDSFSPWILACAALESMCHEKLFFSPTYFHWFKTTLAMAGNALTAETSDFHKIPKPGHPSSGSLDSWKILRTVVSRSVGAVGGAAGQDVKRMTGAGWVVGSTKQRRAAGQLPR